MDVLIIGVGNIGYRHFQGLLSFKKKLNIFLFDISENRLNYLEKEMHILGSIHNITIHRSWNLLPKEYNLIIIATTADNRYTILEKILTEFKVPTLIIEKILFQDKISLNNFTKLLMNNPVKAYVNYPRRLYNLYSFVKKNLSQNQKYDFKVLGGNWGLCSNGLHFLDLFEYLTESKVDYITNKGVNNEIIKSKRENYIEMTGEISGSLKNGCTFSISSIENSVARPITISILNSSNKILIQELKETCKLSIVNLESGFTFIKSDFDSNFQSKLTTKIINEIYETGNCSLPNFTEVAETHILFLDILLDHFNEVTKENIDFLRVT